VTEHPAVGDLHVTPDDNTSGTNGSGASVQVAKKRDLTGAGTAMSVTLRLLRLRPPVRRGASVV
jgi:hypothetical protein